jgi:hypothetical protein
MKQKNLIIGAFSLAAVILAAGLISSASAQTEAKDLSEFRNEQRQNRSFMMRGNNLSEEQKSEMEAKRAERQAEAQLHREKMDEAINSGSYETWSAIVSETMGEDFFLLEKVTADNFAEFVAMHNERQVNKEEMGQRKGFGRNMGEKMGERFQNGAGNCPFISSLEK